MAETEKGGAPVEKKADKPAKAKKPSLAARTSKWFRELKGELKKIVWPTRQQTINNTAVVIATIFLVGIFIWVLDAIFNFGLQTLISYFA